MAAMEDGLPTKALLERVGEGDECFARICRVAIEERAAKVVILGQGYVGLPLAVRLLGAGFSVRGIEPNGERTAAIAAGTPCMGPGSDALAAGLMEPLAQGQYEVSISPESLATAQVAIVCVPTPLAPDRQPDLSAVGAAGFEIGRLLPPGSLCVLESTTYPGTTRGVFLDAIAKGREGTPFRATDLFIAYSPEREDPGRAESEIARAPKLVGGLNPRAEALAVTLYQTVFKTVHPTNGAEVAEAAKLFENVFRSVNIALVNEAKTVLEAMGIDVWRVLDAAATKPFGFMPFAPGPGLGGHCIPIDPFYFAWAAEQHGVRARFVELAGEVNRAMPSYVTSKLEQALEQRGQSLRGARILVFGLAYKADVADLRESPALDLIDRLLLATASVEAADPHVAKATTPGGAELESIEPTVERIAAAAAVLIVTDHTDFDYPAIAAHAQLAVDTRGILRAFAKQLGDRLVRA